MLPGELADAVVDLEIEQPGEQIAALRGLVVQEPGELALGQHDAAREVRERQAEQLLDGGLQLARAAREDLHDLAVGTEPFEDRLRRARLPGPHPDDARRPVPVLAHGELERHLGFLLADAHDARGQALVAVAGHAAVQGEAERVDDGRLAHARRADEREVVDTVEVDVDGLAEDAEPFGVQGDRPHQTCASATASSYNRSKSRTTRGSSIPSLAEVLGEQFVRRATAAEHAVASRAAPATSTSTRTSTARGNNARDVVGEAGARGLADDDAQPRVTDARRQFVQLGEGPAHGPQRPRGSSARGS